MIRNLQIEIKETKGLTDDVVYKINSLKNQYWKYSNEDHMKWFRENIREEDEHLMLWGGVQPSRIFESCSC